ncbi:SUMF1/EgtB/PvdO family nonheme iron enzyme [Paludisphaera soli]|uniref:SUMF1/EgtB/PvdO family nonheme iron enzyme n=1 Tax=Paludisphaera soli TaxID=2712865 RepID=UPI0013EDB8F9|nr:SUMF1/EgtB/PvdO family nonheme iron enzyme [Paludisphaera soli]
MATIERLGLEEIERRVCDVASEQLSIPRAKLAPGLRIVQDLHVDSLDLVELFMEVEEAFDVTLPDRSADPVFKAVFTRPDFRLADLAELVYLVQGSGAPRSDRGRDGEGDAHTTIAGFTQLGGRWEGRSPVWEVPIADGAVMSYRRRTDGMRCLPIPSAVAELGDENPDAPRDERPVRRVEIDAFVIDAEPVSTTAYCRFLNSIGEVGPDVLADWFVLHPDDDRDEHHLVRREGSTWRPLPGVDRKPMILVSWFGANAYSLWALGCDWRRYGGGAGDPEGFLPTEAQWEYASRGASRRTFPWGEASPSPELLQFGRHRRGASYVPATLPMADVNVDLGVSPFGARHMAGNVWHWCRDWYAADFPGRPEASAPNPANRTPTGVRAERGGSWVGPASLCRSSARRGRPPSARGRCLGFRCVAPLP